MKTYNVLVSIRFQTNRIHPLPPTHTTPAVNTNQSKSPQWWAECANIKYYYSRLSEGVHKFYITTQPHMLYMTIESYVLPHHCTYYIEWPTIWSTTHMSTTKASSVGDCEGSSNERNAMQYAYICCIYYSWRVTNANRVINTICTIAITHTRDSFTV